MNTDASTRTTTESDADQEGTVENMTTNTSTHTITENDANQDNPF